jgi:hypothetical protein
MMEGGCTLTPIDGYTREYKAIVLPRGLWKY